MSSAHRTDRDRVCTIQGESLESEWTVFRTRTPCKNMLLCFKKAQSTKEEKRGCGPVCALADFRLVERHEKLVSLTTRDGCSLTALSESTLEYRKYTGACSSVMKRVEKNQYHFTTVGFLEATYRVYEKKAKFEEKKSSTLHQTLRKCIFQIRLDALNVSFVTAQCRKYSRKAVCSDE